MKKLLLSLLVCVSLLSSPAYALNIFHIFKELLPQGEQSSGGVPFTGVEEMPVVDEGVLNVSTYNIDGFPHSMGGNTAKDTKKISKILDVLALDVVLFQENFTKNEELNLKLNDATYPYRANHFSGNLLSFGDGLGRISYYPFDASEGFDRVQWDACGGTLGQRNPDCLTEKGFTMTRTYISDGFSIDIYNLHQDAGGDQDSLDAKRINMRQLAEYINRVSKNHVVIVGGDYNLGWSSNEVHREIVVQFLEASGLTFACAELSGSLDGCNDDPDFDKPDHIAFGGNDDFSLDVISLRHLEDFGISNKIDPDGLSDHVPLSAEFHWQRRYPE